MSEMSEPSEASVSQRSAEDEQSTINTSTEPQVEFSASTAPADDRPASSSVVGETSMDAASASAVKLASETSEEFVAEPSGAAADAQAEDAAGSEEFEADADIGKEAAVEAESSASFTPSEALLATAAPSPPSPAFADTDALTAPTHSQAFAAEEGHELTYSTVSGPSSLTSSMHEPVPAVMRQATSIATLHHTGEQHSNDEAEMEMVVEVVTEQPPSLSTATAAADEQPIDSATTEPSLAPQPTSDQRPTSATQQQAPPILSALPAPYIDDPLADNLTSSRPATTAARTFIPPQPLHSDLSSEQPAKHFPADFSYAADSAELSRPLRPFQLSPAYVQLHQSFSMAVQQRSNLHYIDAHTLLYVAGNTAQLHEYETGRKLVVHGHTHSDGGGVASIALHPSRSCFAVAEKGQWPHIYIYSYPGLQVLRILRRGTEAAYSHVEFNAAGDKLASVGAHPDYTLAVWEWAAERVILKTKAFSQNVHRVSFAPSDDGRLITAGVGHIRFWDMARTFTGLKLQGAIGKFGGVELSDISAYVELPDGRVLSGSESGRLLMWDGHLIQYQVVQLDDGPCHAGEISVVRLRAGGRRVVAKGLLRLGLGTLDELQVVAHAPDVHRVLQRVAEVAHDLGAELHGVGFAVHVRRPVVVQQPVLAAVHPHVEAEIPDQAHGLLGVGARQGAGLDDGKVRLDEQAAVEAGDGGGDGQRLDHHAHALGRTAGGDGEGDAALVQRVHRRLGALGEHLLRGHQGAVDVGQHEADAVGTLAVGHAAGSCAAARGST